MYWIQFFLNSAIPEPELNSVTMLCMLMMCMKLRNLRTNCSVLTSVIWSVLSLLH